MKNLQFTNAFKDLEDPRSIKTQRHNFLEILITALCATVCGAEGWEDMTLYGKSNELWLKCFLKLENGIPCPDTYRRVFSSIRPGSFEDAFRAWTRNLFEATEEKILALDGKKIRSSNPINLISAWCHGNNGLCLAQKEIKEGGSEISELPELLKILEIKGCLLTMDAAHCQKKTMQAVVEGNADYLVSVKGNQPELFHTIKDFFTDLAPEMKIPLMVKNDVEKGHGRVETRKYTVSGEVEWMPCLPQWPGLKSIIMVERGRWIKGKETLETQYYISSLTPDLDKLSRAIRGHWSIENSQHWVLDVTFGEDDTKIRDKNAQKNMALMRKIALNKLSDKKAMLMGQNVSLKQMRKICAWNPSYLLKLLEE